MTPNVRFFFQQPSNIDYDGNPDNRSSTKIQIGHSRLSRSYYRYPGTVLTLLVTKLSGNLNPLQSLLLTSFALEPWTNRIVATCYYTHPVGGGRLFRRVLRIKGYDKLTATYNGSVEHHSAIRNKITESHTHIPLDNEDGGSGGH
jgi:hypothetical protein